MERPQPVTPTGPNGGDADATDAGAIGGLGVDAAARQRSSSPWAFKIGGKVVSHSNDGSGVSTPVMSARYGGRFPSAGAASRQAAGQSALLTAVRRQIDSFEDKVGTQISRMQQQEHKLREAAVSRLEEKMHATEGAQPKLDRRIAELTGNFKGLSDEMQSQIRRVDSVEERFYDWRHALEEDFRQKISDLEQQIQKVQSSTRVMYSSLEDMQKKQNTRLQRTELDAGDRLAVHEETREALLTLHSRLEVLEDRSPMEEMLVPSSPNRGLVRSEARQEVDNNAAMLSLLERRMGDVSEKLERVVQDAIDLHQTSKQQEVQLSSLRMHFDARQDQVRKLSERLENSDLDSRVEQLRRNADEDRNEKVGVLEKIELVSRRLEAQEQSHEVLRSRHDQLMQHSFQRSPLSPLSPRGMNLELDLDAVVGNSRGGGDAVLEDCISRLVSAENRIEDIDIQLSTMREAQDVSPHIGALVGQLTEIVPKVIDQEKRLGDLNSKCQLQDEARNKLQGRVQELESHGGSRNSSAQDGQSGSSSSLGSFRKELDDKCDAMRREMDTTNEVLRSQADHSMRAVEDLKEVRSATEKVSTQLRKELETVRLEVTDLLEQVATKEQLGAATSQLKTSFQQMCQDEDARLRKQLEDSIATSNGQAQRHIEAEVQKALAKMPQASSSGSLRPELLQALQQDEDAERHKQQKLLERIDELCSHVEAVDSAVGKVTMLGRSSSQPVDGIPADLSEQCKVLAERVEEQSRKSVELHSKVNGKFDQLDSIIRKVEALSRKG